MISPEWLGITMFAVFMGLIMVGYPVAFTLAGTALAFAVIGSLTGHFEPLFLNAMPSRIYGNALARQEPRPPNCNSPSWSLSACSTRRVKLLDLEAFQIAASIFAVQVAARQDDVRPDVTGEDPCPLGENAKRLRGSLGCLDQLQIAAI